MNRLITIFLMLISGVSLTGTGLAGPSGAASQVIEQLNGALLDVMQNAEKLGYKGRYKKLSEVIEETHDLRYIARFSIGRKNWENLSDDQRKRLVDAFHAYSVAAYSNRFNAFSGEKFRVIGEQPGKRGRTQVNAEMEIPGEETINFVYLLGSDKESPKIVNIIVQGVSDLALKRAEFKTLLSEQGFDALLGHLAEKTRQYEETAGS